MKKLFSVFFLVMLLTSCCDEKIYEITVDGIRSRVLTYDGSNYIEYDGQNSIDKEELIIEAVFTELEEVVSIESKINKNEEADIVEAAVVPCDPQTTIYKNQVESIRVVVLDSDNNNERIDITNQLVTVDSQTPLTEYVSEYGPGIRGFSVQLSDTTILPDRIAYEIAATLDDGRELETSGGIISFN